MRKIVLSVLLTCTSLSLLFSQPEDEDYSRSGLNVEAQLINPTKRINDAKISLKVTGGKAPYSYKWSNQETPLSSSVSENIIEGIPYQVIVTDANGASITKTYKVPSKSITEIFNGIVQPAVDFQAAILFWDPFASLNLYDPVIYTDEAEVAIPNWSPNKDRIYTLKKWYVADNTHIQKGEKLAKILDDKGNETIAYAEANGTLTQYINAGEIIYDSTKQADVIEQGAHNLAKITFDDPQPLYHPNGDKRKNNIPFIVVWLILGSIFFTFKLGFVNIKGFKHSIQLAQGKFDNPNAPGTITHFQAMATAVSATVGLGNIAGVAVAISLGGAGATFWMFLAGFFGMSLKFVECTLGVKYRHINHEGRIFGGPMNYLRYGLEKRNMKGLGKALAILFALLGVGASLGGGNMLQANQAFEIVETQLDFLHGHGFEFGIGFALLVGAVIIGGINSIAKVTSKVVPIMAIIYVVGSLIIIGVNYQNIGTAFTAIFEGAFSAQALKGGFLGVLIVGLQRAAFSSEAGVGSAAIAHSASKTETPIADGYAALIEPFIDTMVVCTMTALVLIFTGKHEVSEVAGVALTSEAFASVISWFPSVLAVAVFLFAFSTMISWSYYGMRSWTYLFGKSKKSELLYKILFLVFVVVGASVSLGAVLDFSDMMILAMSFPNIIGLYIMAGEVKQDMKAYVKKLKNNELYRVPETTD
ncbi:MAG: amino acid carrier protein [Mesonia hippocampi]|uniref:amino acid carrier protein n=1 Tax=Mesonia hippocampi TaxID=1628250 RepID=UPI003F96518A